MNDFFLTHGDVPFEPPLRAYARFEQSEPQDPEDAKEAVFIFSAIDADLLDGLDDNRFHLDPAGPAPEYWRHVFGDRKWPTHLGDDPFERIPLRRYEISVARSDRAYKDLVERVRDEQTWTLLRHKPSSAMKADVFANLFQSDPHTIPVVMENVPAAHAKTLSLIFDMDTWPDATEADIESALKTSAVTGHVGKGWAPGSWSGVSNPGHSVAGADFLATAEHVSTHLGGIIAGWKAPPTPSPRPCRPSFCTTDILQS